MRSCKRHNCLFPCSRGFYIRESPCSRMALACVRIFCIFRYSAHTVRHTRNAHPKGMRLLILISKRQDMGRSNRTAPYLFFAGSIVID